MAIIGEKDESGRRIITALLITQKQADLPANMLVLKTTVTPEMGRDIAATHGLETIES